jgi:hypothetical protein
VRRILFDFSALGLLLGTDFLIGVLGIKTSLPIAISLPVAVGFGRGFAEERWVGNAPYWVSGTEWAVIVIIEYSLACYVGVLLRPYDNFETVFGFGLLIVLAPSLVLSLISYWLGFRFAKRAVL